MDSRVRLHHLILAILCYCVYAFLKNRSAPIDTATSLSFCPISTSSKHIPTVILQAGGATPRTEERTHWVGGRKPALFLPYLYPPRDLRFAQSIHSTSQNSPQLKGQGRLDLADEHGDQLCNIHRVPSSPPPLVGPGWEDHNIMYGMATTPDRVLYNLPVWAHWLPRAPHPLDPGAAETKRLPLVLILAPPPNPTEAARTLEAMEEAQVLGMFVEMRVREADRFETRYFGLMEELWAAAMTREEEHGVRTEWFAFVDDDTFYPDYDSLARLLSSQSSSDDVLIGAMSESKKQVAQWGEIAYGGAGIYVSRSLVGKMNAPGVWKTCMEKFGSSFGGDAMISACAALVLQRPVPSVITLEPTLHQLDIRGDATGWFQSGFLITSLHHWASWFNLFPPWHESGAGDLRVGIELVGKAGKAIGGDNWGRRYVFEDGRVIVHLGYSVVVEGKALTEDALDKSEHTWWEFETFYPLRPAAIESLTKRTYYLTAARSVPLHPGVVRLEHKNREGERVDIVWDARPRVKPRWSVFARRRKREGEEEEIRNRSW